MSILKTNVSLNMLYKPLILYLVILNKLLFNNILISTTNYN